MDPLTQGLLGASFGQALYGRALGRRALVWGALVGMAPDLDVVANGTSPVAEWLWHRGLTHSVWFGPVVGPLVGWLLWRSTKSGRLRDWIGLAIVALLTHPLLDLFTTYGTQLLAPFSSHRFALDGVAIIDPAYSLVLAGAILIGLRRGVATAASARAASVALVVSTAYLGAGVWMNERVEARVRAQLAASGPPTATVAAYPTMLQLPFRRVVVRKGDEVLVGWTNALRVEAVSFERFSTARGPLVDAARATYEGRVLEWFAMGEATPRVSSLGGETVVEIDDLRYGFPGHPRDGLWGVRVYFDASSRPVRAERFDRPLPAPPRRILEHLWRGTIGVS
jgi:inner membrane protein